MVPIDHFKHQFPDSVLDQQDGWQRKGATEYHLLAKSESELAF